MGEKRINKSPSEIAREADYHKRQHGNQEGFSNKDPRQEKVAKETPRELKNRKNRESKTRSAIMRTDLSLLGGSISFPANLNEYIETLVLSENCGVSNDDKASAIFSPTLKAITDLPIGLLTEKECMLPRALVPSGFSEILRHCRRMISVSGDKSYIAYAVAGWKTCSVDRAAFRKMQVTAQQNALRHLDAHARALAQIEADHPKLFEAILCGRHKTALDLLSQRTPESVLKPHHIRAVIAEHGLIYCLHDLQLIAARAHAAEANPFESLASSTMIQMKPENIANQSRRQAATLNSLLAQYATLSEELGGKLPPEEIPDRESLRSLANQVRYEAKKTGTNLLSHRSQIDDLIRFMRNNPVSKNLTYLAILHQPVSRNGMATSFNAFWFSGLSATQTVSVAILRYLQAEKTIKMLIEERDPRSVRPLREHTAMPAYELSPKAPDTFREAQDLLFMLRQNILHDKDFTTNEESVWERSDREGRPPIKKAAEVLKEWGQREIGADKGSLDDAGRTYYLLDVIPEHRLAY
ncbi:hypothetical protein QQS45_05605 [Alteriqipengyuania flavescens]|uniref:hypothetical protein n=1 Tax=Alteriqipengyuania flavescens TaxID=3053610 RepID=UPI0025B2DA86|nr:hypothetical protein [Alteriqipengyuania flavescens]WJY19692.1 hypothetical protein QQW98_05600 [Alteriqipengyuania flavescens]WJY25632.1 hypothetical protein QQS45_05605 [Alteriqipengyuania flavescens]